MTEPLRSKIAECCTQARITGDTSGALQDLSLKIGHEKFYEVIANLEIGSKYRANYTELIDSLRDDMRAYLRGREEDKARASYYNYYTSKKWGALDSYDIFNEMSEKIKENVTRVVLHQSKVTEEQTNTANLAKATEMIKKMIAARNLQAQNQANTSGKNQPVVNSTRKVGRNEPCPCGSGKKYKHCCGK